MRRRLALATLAATPLAINTRAAAQAAAASPPGSGTPELKPYLTVKTVTGEERNVRVYFAPSCPFSRQYLSFFGNLAKTLPDKKTFVWTPLANASDGMMYPIAFAAVARHFPAYVPNFVEASLLGVQEHQISVRSWAGLDRIGRAAQIPLSIARLVAQRGDAALKADVQRLLAVQGGLSITNTPSVAVGGTYIVTPEFTLGDPQAFSQLVNAVISMTY